MHIEASNTRDFRAFPLSSRSILTRSNQPVRRSCEFTAQRERENNPAHQSRAPPRGVPWAYACVFFFSESRNKYRAVCRCRLGVVSDLRETAEHRSGFTPDARQPNESRKEITTPAAKGHWKRSKRKPRSSLDVLPRGENESSTERIVFSVHCLLLPYTPTLKKAARSETSPELPTHHRMKMKTKQRRKKKKKRMRKIRYDHPAPINDRRTSMMTTMMMWEITAKGALFEYHHRWNETQLAWCLRIAERQNQFNALSSRPDVTRCCRLSFAHGRVTTISPIQAPTISLPPPNRLSPARYFGPFESSARGGEKREESPCWYDISSIFTTHANSNDLPRNSYHCVLDDFRLFIFYLLCKIYNTNSILENASLLCISLCLHPFRTEWSWFFSARSKIIPWESYPAVMAFWMSVDASRSRGISLLKIPIWEMLEKDW